MPQKQFAWMEYTNPDDDEDSAPFLARVRTDLSIRETNTLTFQPDTPVPDIWEAVAPFVVDWNLGDEDGNAISPPADAGGMQFDYLNNTLFWELFRDIKFRSGGTVEAKRLTPSRPTVPNDGASSTSATSSGEPATGES